MAKVSVIVPIYNQAFNSNFRRCINSILTQTFRNFELILVNDGSTDRSGELCHEYVKQDKRISVIHREHRDLGAARNAGIAHASSEFITFIESDDFIHKEMLQVLYDQLVQTKADIAICDFMPIEEGTPIKENRRKKPVSIDNVSILSSEEALHHIFDAERVFTIPWSKMYRKELLLKYKYPDGVVDEDEFIAHKLLYETEKIAYVHAPLYYYVIAVGRKGSYTPIPMTEEKFVKMLALYERAVFFRKKKLKTLEERALIHFAEHFFWFYLQSQKELPQAHARRKEIKKIYNRLFFRLIRCSQLSKKKKIVCTIFRISPSLHKILLVRREEKRLVKQT